MPCQYSFAFLSAQLLIADLTLLNETGNVSSGLGRGKELAARANWSALCHLLLQLDVFETCCDCHDTGINVL